MKKGSVYVVGSVNADFVMSVNHLPQQGETIQSEKFLLNYGGKGANQAKSCAVLGLNTKLIGSVGVDQFGEQALLRLKNSSVDIKHMHVTKKEQTGLALIIEQHGDNRIILNPGANQIFTSNQLNVLQSLNENDVVLSQLEIPNEIVLKAFESAKKNHATTILNAAPAKKDITDIFKLTDILIINQSEAKILTNVYPTTTADIKQAYKILKDKGIKKLVLTLGENGSVICDKDLMYKAKSFKIKPIDSTGAGDTFIGGYIKGLMENWNDQEILTFANACGAYACLSYGAEFSMGTTKEIEKFIRENKDE